MPVRKMTHAESERIFGSGFVIFGMKRPTKPAIHDAKEMPYGQVTNTSGVATGGDAFRGQEIADPAHIQDPNPMPVRKK
jgi:hypothetical protein